MRNDASGHPTPGPGWWVDDSGRMRPPPTAGPTQATAVHAEPPPAPSSGESLPPPIPPAGGRVGLGTAHATVDPGDGPAVEPAGGALGTSFTWACGALRGNALRLGIVSAIVGAVLVVGLLIVVIVGAAAAEMNVASLSVLLGVLGSAAALAAAALTWYLLARAWFDVARGDEIRVELVDPRRLGAAVVLALVLVPFSSVVPFLAPFVVMAFLLLVETGTAGSAMGRMMVETMASARRFLHTLVIGVISTAWALGLVLVWSWFNVLIGASVGSSSFVDTFSGNDSALRDVDQDATTWFGLGIGGLAVLLAALLLVHLVGLWSAGLLRRFTGRALARPATEPVGVAP